jgi:hypothetical protein
VVLGRYRLLDAAEFRPTDKVRFEGRYRIGFHPQNDTRVAKVTPRGSSWNTRSRDRSSSS